MAQAGTITVPVHVVITVGTAPEVVHACPPDGSGVMPCCGRTPFECMADRMTSDPDLVTCIERLLGN